MMCIPACSSAQRPAFASKFTGKERDAETGLDYFLARYYSGAQGRFLSPDEFKGGPDDALTGRDITPPGPLPYADIGNPQSLNKYAYTYNNPLRYTDPDGHCPICVVVIGAAALVLLSDDTANAPGPEDHTIPRNGDGQILANGAIGGAIGYGISKIGGLVGDLFGGTSKSLGTETVERAISKSELSEVKPSLNRTVTTTASGKQGQNITTTITESSGSTTFKTTPGKSGGQSTMIIRKDVEGNVKLVKQEARHSSKDFNKPPDHAHYKRPKDKELF
jgi:RHS repeat-associated protein